MLTLSADTYVRIYFEGATKSMSPAVRQIVLEDIEKLLKGDRGEFLEFRREIGDHFLEVCDNYGVLLSFPTKKQ